MRLAVLVKYATTMLVLCGWSHQSVALELDTFFKRKDQRAVELINDAQYDEAIELLDSGSLRGVSRYRRGDYENAIEDFATGDDAVSLYNHGTTAARLGDYDTAVASLEKALEIDPVNQSIKNNLEVARELRDMKDDSSQHNQQGDNNQEQDSEEGESDNQQQNSDSETDSENSDSQQSNEQQSNEQQSNEQGGGELAESAKNSEPRDSEQQAEQAVDEQSESEEQRQAELEAELSESEGGEEGEPLVAGSPEPVSEDDQATQQWLRRIPDDGSQLLRNKIKLNKYLEYPEVQDQPEAW